MNIFKLRQGEHHSVTLTASNFHTETGKKAPWFQRRGDKMMHYAVCPECDNPMNIVNLDVDRKVDLGERPLPLYAKHAISSVEGIGEYDREAYEDCSLRDPSSFNGKSSKRKPGKVANGIVQALIDRADAVHFFIERFLGLDITDALFESLLREFHKQDGQLYRAASTSNLPYALLYMGGNQSTYGCRAKQGSPFYEALAHSSYFKIKDDRSFGYKQAKQKPNPRLRFFVTDHVIRKVQSEQGMEQTMTLVVEEELGDTRTQLLLKPIELEIDFFRKVADKRLRLRELAKAALA
ncbi:hypothetical protein [Dyella sp. GSA-30]|uniref:hypothetical protein n=1 Tax=Dyella sp. GSA-30 TaxID=2994496 RepID=UPI002492D790|nr:hypothetical protein [Dyella sp. GSA-30]BDU19610.1 hypothetical protein DYGSA30_10670 [Dyella sp. GSA-30]